MALEYVLPWLIGAETGIWEYDGMEIPVGRGASVFCSDGYDVDELAA